MTEQELLTVLAIVGHLTEGEITIRKKSGSPELEIEMNTHPIWGIYFLADALGQTLYRAGHTGDDLELDLTGDNARKLLHQLADTIADSMAEAAP